MPVGASAVMASENRVRALAYDGEHALNAICPYFTMFPLEFPLRVLRQVPEDALVFDPYCGRGTTNYAARHLGLQSCGIDTSPVAVAIARAKEATSTADRVVRLAERLLQRTHDYEVPVGQFWRRAFHQRTLHELCKLRSALGRHHESQTSTLLRALILGILHGPLSKSASGAGYLSNQMPRTFAPKPNYAVRFWKKRGLTAPRRDTLAVLRRKAERALSRIPTHRGESNLIRRADSREARSYAFLQSKITHVVTSPPYYGLRTYVEDQWIRSWFLGGASAVEYGACAQLNHESPEIFAQSLADVWDRIAERAAPGLKMVVRFGSIGSRECEPKAVLRSSLRLSAAEWQITFVREVEPQQRGRRQSTQMACCDTANPEYDFYIALR
jgi:hypothetical protein